MAWWSTDARAPDARLAYVTPSCQFPLGVALSLERRRALLDWARRAQAWIVEDDYDCDCVSIGSHCLACTRWIPTGG